MSSAHAHAEHNPLLAHHFQNMEQQKEACTLGMWLFLAQEVMFFGGMFLAYAVYRYLHMETFITASKSLNIPIGAVNTVVLLLSSFSMAMGVYYCQVGRIKNLFYMLIVTLLLGCLFVGLKLTLEWAPKIEGHVIPGLSFGPIHHYEHLSEQHLPDQKGLQLFFWLYFVMTGMHALHMIIGFGIILVLMVGTLRGKFGPDRYLPIEFFGLYWHFVDIVWVFLFPMFYLIR
jgi:cytochrome c oxidase subunit III